MIDMLKKIIYASVLCIASMFAPVGFLRAQTPQERYEAFRRQARQQYEDFRSKANQQYADFVKQTWQRFHANEPIPDPFEKPVPPVVCPEEDRQKERKDEKRPYEEIVVVEPPRPQPQPVEPVKPVVPPTPRQETIGTTFYGTRIQCTVASKPQFALKGVDEEAIAETWQTLSSGQCDELLGQCLELRSRYKLNDWGYIQLLDQLAQQCCSLSNDVTLLMAWLYCQSGYRMRLGREGNRLYMLYASTNIIYRTNFFTIENEKFYPYKCERLESVCICGAYFPKEQSMTLEMHSEPQLTYRSSDKRMLQSERYADVKVSTSVNQNLIDFYNHYPTGSTNKDFGTRWAMYANTPLSHGTRAIVYPQLQNLLAGKDKLQAAEELLNWVQTAFVYEYDDTVWGYDRAFFAEETFFYPYADCEDRSILFSRLTRDLLDLDVVLLYYPGHLATAVRFESERPRGDFLSLPDGDYYIADPTYIGAPIGLTMPEMKDKPVKVIELQHQSH